MQQAQMTTLYKARYPVTIMGRKYATGDVIDDPTIDGKVLRRMSDNNRVVLVPMVQNVSHAQIKAGEFDDGPDDDEDDGPDDDEDGGEDGSEDAPESPPESDDAPEGSVAPAQAPIEALTAPAGAGEASAAATPDNRAWKAAFAAHRAEGETIKGYLQRVLMSNSLPITGTVPDMVKRLTSAGVQPGAAGH